ncbi:unnamed protein product, partial [Prorocentrum cordatum]
VLLLGLALFYAELQPVEVEFRNGATEEFWNEKQTPTMLKVFNDTTRHRYGDDAHLDSSLKALGLTVSKGRYPQMKSIIISKTEDEELEFTMTFVSKDVPFTTWSDPAKLISFDRFFGPGIWSSVYKVSGETGEEDRRPEADDWHPTSRLEAQEGEGRGREPGVAASAGRAA